MNSNNDNIEKANIKVKNQWKNKTLIVLLLIFIIVTVLVLILNSPKEEIQKYGGMTFKKEMNLSNVNIIESSDEEPVEVPVPKGYTASSVESERKVKGGFVIYEGEEEVTEENLEEAKRTRNQFV